MTSLLLVFYEAHGGSCARIYIIRLHPLVTHLSISYVISILSTDFAMVMHLIAKVECIIAVIDSLLSREVALVETALHGCLAK